MIIGNGMLAKAFQNHDFYDTNIIFASGVSNSVEERQGEFERERVLLSHAISDNPGKKLVYFSSCSINDEAVKDRMYVKHKLLMEDYISQNTDNYLICRVSNVVGNKGNPNTLINYLYNCISNRIPFQVWINSERNIIDVDDLVYYVTKLNELNIQNRIVNIANGKSFKVTEIVSAIEDYCGVKGVYERVNKGVALNIDTSFIDNIACDRKPPVKSAHEYITTILKKYFANASC